MNRVIKNMSFSLAEGVLLQGHAVSLGAIKSLAGYMSMVSCQKGPTRHAYARQIGPFWQDTLDVYDAVTSPEHHGISEKGIKSLHVMLWSWLVKFSAGESHGHFSVKMLSYLCRKSHCTNEMIIWLFYLLMGFLKLSKPLHWHHNGRDSVPNHQPHDCLLNRLFRCRSKKTSKLCVTGLCVGNSSGTGEFPAQTANNMENVSIWWRHHATFILTWVCVFSGSPCISFSRICGN